MGRRAQVVEHAAAALVALAVVVGSLMVIFGASGRWEKLAYVAAPAGGAVFLRALFRLIDAVAVLADAEGGELEQRDRDRYRDAEVRRAGSDYKPF